MNRLKNSYSGCMNCGGKVKMKSGGKSYSKAVTKSAYSSTTAKKANLANTLLGIRKGDDGMITSRGTKNVIKYASRVEPRGITTESSMGMPVAPAPINFPAVNTAVAAPVVAPVNTPVAKALSPERQKVKSYQEMLRSKGYDIAADGAWGPKTQAAYDSYIKSKTTSTNSASKVPAVSKSVVPAAQKLNPNFKITAATPYMRTSPAGKVGYTNTTRVGSFDPISRKTADMAEYARKVGYIRQTPGKKVYPTTKG